LTWKTGPGVRPEGLDPARRQRHRRTWAVRHGAAVPAPPPFDVDRRRWGRRPLLGIPESDRADLGRWFRTLLAPDCGPDAVAASQAIVGYLGALLDLKRAEPAEDLDTDLVAAREGALTE
jgi:hypothetical protein